MLKEGVSMIGDKEINKAIKEKCLSGKTLFVHASLKSFGDVDGGPLAIVNAFIDEKCTIVVPTFSYNFEVPPPRGRVFEQNGMNTSEFEINKEHENKIYSSKCNEISKSMGAIPATVLAMKDRSRGIHPLNSFTAIGPRAEEIIATQDFENVYGPFEKVYEEGGLLLLMGVDLNRATAIHFAEKLAGRNLFARWARTESGEVKRVRVGSCSEGFQRLEPFVSSIQDSVVVGNCTWKIYDFRMFVDAIVEAIKINPDITHCEDKGCLRCGDMLKGGLIDI